MILAGGKIYETSEQPRLLDSLAGEISRTRQTLSLDPEKVINAADKLGKRAAAGEFSGMISEFLPDFPGRGFRILSVGDFSKRSLKVQLQGVGKANLTLRNFPSSVDMLRKQLKIKEGGEDYLFATTWADGRHVLIRCRR